MHTLALRQRMGQPECPLHRTGWPHCRGRASPSVGSTKPERPHLLIVQRTGRPRGRGWASLSVGGAAPERPHPLALQCTGWPGNRGQASPSVPSIAQAGATVEDGPARVSRPSHRLAPRQRTGQPMCPLHRTGWPHCRGWASPSVGSTMPERPHPLAL